MMNVTELLGDDDGSPLKMRLVEYRVTSHQRFCVEESSPTVGCNVCLSDSFTCSIRQTTQHNHYEDGLYGIWASPATVDVEFAPARHCWLSVFLERSSLEECWRMPA